MSVTDLLASLFSEGGVNKPRLIFLKTGEKISPPTGKIWILLTGILNHITGTGTVFSLHDVKGLQTIWTTLCASANANGTYPIWATNAVTTQSQYHLIVCTDREYFSLSGGAGSYARFQVIQLDEGGQ